MRPSPIRDVTPFRPSQDLEVIVLDLTQGKAVLLIRPPKVRAPVAGVVQQLMAVDLRVGQLTLLAESLAVVPVHTQAQPAVARHVEIDPTKDVDHIA